MQRFWLLFKFALLKANEAFLSCEGPMHYNTELVLGQGLRSCHLVFESLLVLQTLGLRMIAVKGDMTST